MDNRYPMTLCVNGLDVPVYAEYCYARAQEGLPSRVDLEGIYAPQQVVDLELSLTTLEGLGLIDVRDLEEEIRLWIEGEGKNE